MDLVLALIFLVLGMLIAVIFRPSAEQPKKKPAYCLDQDLMVNRSFDKLRLGHPLEEQAGPRQRNQGTFSIPTRALILS